MFEATTILLSGSRRLEKYLSPLALRFLAVVCDRFSSHIQVHPGNLKISLSVSDWPFCDPSTAPTRNGKETPSTVCWRGTQGLETGAYLEMVLSIRGPSFLQPVLLNKEAMAGGGRNDDAIIGRGVEYVMSGGSADAKLIMSEWVETDAYGWTEVCMYYTSMYKNRVLEEDHQDETVNQ